MQAFARPKRAIGPVDVVTSDAMLTITVVLLVSVEAVSETLAGWASAQTLATLSLV